MFKQMFTMVFVSVLVLSLTPLSADQVLPDDPYAYTWHELAPGVWSGLRENGPQAPVMGTSTFVVGDDGVVVFDGGGAPLMSERLMEKVAEVTDQPITHVVISHWHGDHHFGIWRIIEEFPDVQVISHEFTRSATLGAPMDYIKDSGTAIERFAVSANERLSTGMESDGETPLSEDVLGYYRYVLEHKDLLEAQFKQYAATAAAKTFENKMTIYTGTREIQLLHVGVGNTEGDVIMWLPQEKIVATGDVVVLPTPYAFNVYPERWRDTLQAINELDYEILVPGHGEIQRNKDYTNLMIEALDSIIEQSDQFLEAGLTQEEAETRYDYSAFEQRFTGGDPYVAFFYNAYFVEPLSSAAYRAAKGEVLVELEP